MVDWMALHTTLRTSPLALFLPNLLMTMIMLMMNFMMITKLKHWTGGMTIIPIGFCCLLATIFIIYNKFIKSLVYLWLVVIAGGKGLNAIR